MPKAIRKANIMPDLPPMAPPMVTMRMVSKERRKAVLSEFIWLPPLVNLSAKAKKKDLYPRHICLDKGLVDRISAPVPGLSTVLTETGSAFSLADNYSPLEE